jgi:hypothetical protein
MQYMTGCALGPGQSITFTIAGLPYTFSGDIGVAPSLITEVPTQDDQERVTACLMARTNALGRHVTISISGAGNTIPSDPGESSLYPIYEGTYMGNIFAAKPWMQTCDTAGMNWRADTLLAAAGRSCTTFAGGLSGNGCGFPGGGFCDYVQAYDWHRLSNGVRASDNPNELLRASGQSCFPSGITCWQNPASWAGLVDCARCCNGADTYDLFSGPPPEEGWWQLPGWVPISTSYCH